MILEGKDLAPDSRASRWAAVPKGLVFMYGQWMQPIGCLSCSSEGGFVTEGCTDVQYICNDCCNKYGGAEAAWITSDEAHWQIVQHEQLEKYGRLLDTNELLAAAETPTSPLARLLNHKGR